MALRLRLLVAVAVTALVALVGSDFVTYPAFRSYLENQLDSTLRSAELPLVACLDAGGSLTAPLVAESGPGVAAEVISSSGALITWSAPPGSRVLRLSRGELTRGRQLRPSRGRPVPVSDDCGGVRDAPHQNGRPPHGAHHPEGGRDGDHASGGLGEVAFFSTSGEHRYRVGLTRLSDGRLVAVALGLAPTEAALEHLFLIELAVSAAALAVVLVLGFTLVRVGLRPLVEVEETAEAIMEGDLSARVPDRFRPGTEIGRLANVLNAMIARLSSDIDELSHAETSLRASERRMREFLADASHELRTPIAAISGYAELFSHGAGGRPADLERLLAGIERETARVARLVSDLMLLANLDEGRPIERRPVELVGVVAEAVQASAAIGPEWPVAILATDSVEVLGDEFALRQVIDNLLANVRTHTPAGTSTTATVERVGSEARVTIADHGPGLAEESRTRVFERFARADSARARTSGGAGLGLSIVQAIVRAHGGSVEAGATEGGGLSILIRLPLAPASVDPVR